LTKAGDRQNTEESARNQIHICAVKSGRWKRRRDVGISSRGNDEKVAYPPGLPRDKELPMKQKRMEARS
jgi:hypothetical protein